MRQSLSKAFIIRVLLILLVCQGGFLFWAYVQERNSLAEGLEQKIKVASRLMVNASAKGLSEFDLTYLGLLMDEMLKDDDFVGMNLKDESGFEAMERHKPAKGRVMARSKPVLLGGKEIGTLEISYSMARVDLLLKNRLMIKAGMQAFILGMIALVIFIYFRIRVARRIVRIEEIIRQMTDGDLTVRINDDARDELGAISSGVDILGQRLAEHVARLDSFSQRVSITTHELDAAFTTTTASLSLQHDATEEISRSVSSATASLTQITSNARELLDSSQGNASAVAESLAASEGVAERIDTLHSGMNEAHETVLAIESSANEMATLAAQAADSVKSAVGSAAAIKASFSDIEQVVAESSRLSEQTTQVITTKGIVAVAETQQSMARIFDLSESLQKTVANLGDESKDIANIVTAIADITDKIELLSLNASIIAAQAGEHGRGFAVVAEEMKLLSEMTTRSTSEITIILGRVHHNISDAVAETGEAAQIVQDGNRVVANAGTALQEILSTSRNSQEMVDRIRQAIGLQQEKLKRVVDSLDELRAVSISVSQASTTEKSNIAIVRTHIGELRDAMFHVRVATEQQLTSMNEMLRNIEASTKRTHDISNAVYEAQQVNGTINASLCDVVDVGTRTVDALGNAAARLSAMSREVEKMQGEMKAFKV